MASSRYFSLTAKSRALVCWITRQVIKDRVEVDLSEGASVGIFCKIEVSPEPVKSYPIGMAMEEMRRIIMEMEVAFIATTGKNYSYENACDLIRTHSRAVHKLDNEEIRETIAAFRDKCKEINEVPIRTLYRD